MNFKSPFFYLPVVFVVIIISVIGWQFVPNARTPALLHVLQGDVQVDTGKGYVTATDNMELKEDAKIKTATGAQAAVVLYEGVIIRVVENSEITISELSRTSQQVTQTSGTVWSKVARLGGVENYNVQTPTTTATVRGTSFRTTTGLDQIYSLLVAEGDVALTQAFMDCVADPDCGVHILAHQKIVLDADHPSAYTSMIQNLTPEDIAAVIEELQFELKMLRDLRLREVYKNDVTIALAKTTYGATDEDIANYFLDIDAGRASEQDIIDASPAITPSMRVVFAFDAEIKKTLVALEAYESA